MSPHTGHTSFETSSLLILLLTVWKSKRKVLQRAKSKRVVSGAWNRSSAPHWHLFVRDATPEYQQRRKESINCTPANAQHPINQWHLLSLSESNRAQWGESIMIDGIQAVPWNLECWWVLMFGIWLIECDKFLMRNERTSLFWDNYKSALCRLRNLIDWIWILYMTARSSDAFHS